MPDAQILAASMSHGLAQVQALLANATTTTKPAASTSPVSTIIFFGLLFGVAYMFLIRPQRQRARRQHLVSKEISVGDKVLLSSGIIGHVHDLVGDHAFVEISPGTVIEVLRQAVSQRIEPPPDVDLAHYDDPEVDLAHYDDPEPDQAHYGDPDYGHDALPSVSPLETPEHEADGAGEADGAVEGDGADDGDEGDVDK